MRFYKKHRNDLKVPGYDDTSLIIREANSEVEKANEVISELAASSSEIGRIVEILGSIKERTDLLYVNAKRVTEYEEYSMGTSDIASKEIRQITGDTENAIKAVANNIGMIREDFLKAMDVIQEIAKVTKQVNDISNSIASIIDKKPDINVNFKKHKNNIFFGLKNSETTPSEKSFNVEEYVQMGLNLKSSAENLKYLTKYLQNNLLSNIKNNLKNSLAL